MNLMTNAIVKVLEKMPDSLIWKFAKRYIAGPDLKDGLILMEKLHEERFLSTMDVLGEDTETESDAASAVREYEHLIRGIHELGLPANVSIKLTQIGQKVSQEAMRVRIERLLSLTGDHGLFMRFDIEDSTTTDSTFELYKTLHAKYGKLGVAIQAYLKRSSADLDSLLKAPNLNIRICKGIYNEPSQIAFKDKHTIRQNYMKLLVKTLDGGAYPAIATHDEWLITAALGEIKRRNLDPGKYEFQMLLGVGESARKKLIEDGHRVRIYIPFGQAWKAYSLRRFKENPKLVYYITKNLILPN